MLYLIAGNGAPNFGDELIVAHWLKRYRESGYDGPIVVDGKGTESARLLRDFGDVSFVVNIPRHAAGIEGSYAEFAEAGRAYSRANAAKFEAVELIHFLGGGYVCGNWRNSTRLLGTAVELSQIHGFPLAATGLGMAPFKPTEPADRATWTKLVEAFDLFECRDKASFEAMQEVAGGLPQLHHGLDDAFLEPAIGADRSKRYLHVSGFDADSLFGGLEQSQIARFFDEFDKVLFWTCAHADRDVHVELSAKFPQIVRCSNERLLNGALPLAPQDFMLTSRFHPHLLAARTGMSGYYVARSPFYRAKHALVTDLGSPFRRKPRGDLASFDGGAGRMEAAELGRVEEKRRIADRVVALHDRQRGSRDQASTPVAPALKPRHEAALAGS